MDYKINAKLGYCRRNQSAHKTPSLSLLAWQQLPTQTKATVVVTIIRTLDGNAAKTNPTMCLVDANGLFVQGTSDNADLDGAFYSEGYFDGCTRMIEVGFFQRIEFLPV